MSSAIEKLQKHKDLFELKLEFLLLFVKEKQVSEIQAMLLGSKAYTIYFNEIGKLSKP